jgi:methyl-accepting chemotaxis protein
MSFHFIGQATKNHKKPVEMADILSALSKSQAVIEFKMDGTIITANPNFCAAVGYDLSEIKGQHHSMFAEPELAASQDYKDFWAKLNRGEFHAGQYKRIAKGGREIWIKASYNPIMDKNGNPYKVIKYATDITEKSLETAELQGLVDAIGRSQAVINFELDGTIIDANENFLSVMGYSLDEIKGKHHSMFADKGVSESAEYKTFWENLRAGKFDAGQYKRIGKGGKEIWIEASYNPIMDMNGDVFKVTKFATDLTPRKEENAELANNFETNVQSLVQDVASSATQLQGTSQALAAATEELSASVNEISSQVSNSVTVVSEAVDEAKKSEELVSILVEAAQRIGEVTALINDIAEQTNLLALNATIEAARAGDAGKGFAVVASEVKKLASETAKATEEISSQIGGIQSVSQNTADAIQNIIEVINKVSEISTVISGAVEEQSAATQEVASNIVGVQSSANETGQSASVMSEVSNGLSSRSDDLQSRVNEFLGKVRSM